MHTPHVGAGWRSCAAAGWLLLVGGWLGPIAYGQPAAPLSDQSQISLLTILPGDAAYALFGHSAFRVYDPVQGLDVIYNYGTIPPFDSMLEFVARFAYGRLDYMIASGPYGRAVRFYRDVEQRPMIEQVLNLDAEQREAVYRYLQLNALPENRTYRYDFLFDNCATRLRDVLETTLGSAVRFVPEPDPGMSFRHLLDPYLRTHPVLDLGIDLALGAPVDRVAAPREATFLPLMLRASFDHATVEVEGRAMPLVARTDTVFWIEGRGLPAPQPPWLALGGWVFFGLGLVVTIRQVRRGGAGRALDVPLFGLVGSAGVLIVFLWFISEHHVTAHNWNLLWAWPTHLGAAVLLVRRQPPAWLRPYLVAAAGSALITALGWWAWPQHLPAAALPLILLLALRCAGAAYVSRRRPVVTPAT